MIFMKRSKAGRLIRHVIPFKKKKAPLSIIHFITNRCNARCNHCFIYYNESARKKNPRYNEFSELDLNEIEKITKSFSGKLGAVYLTGGEPFLRDDITDIVGYYIKNSGVSFVSIMTNGFLYNEISKKIGLLCSSYNNANFYVCISIDNYKKKHDKNRNLRNSFENAIKTYHILKEMNLSNLSINVNITVSNQSTRELILLYNFLIKTGINSITCGALRSRPKERMKFNFNGYKKLANLVMRDIKKGKLVSFRGFFGADMLNAKNLALWKRLFTELKENRFIAPCHAGSALGVIHANGDVYPCEILDMRIGNVRDYNYDFLRLWNSKQAENTRKYIRKIKCHCSFECAWSQNIFVEPRNWPILLKEYMKIKVGC